MIVYSVSTLSRTGCINIGYATETGVTQIGFDCSTWLERWPDMTVEVWVTAPGAASAYEARTHRRGDVIVWEVMQSDTQTPGAGRVEVIGYTADKRKLSAVVSTRIEDSMLMAEGTEPPEAQQPWYTAAQEAKARAEALARHAPIIEDGMWMLWDPDKGAYVNSGVQAQGGSGLPEGAGPFQQLVTGADGVPRWEDKLAYENVQTFDVLKETILTSESNGFKEFTVDWADDVNDGDEGLFVSNGNIYKYRAVAASDRTYFRSTTSTDDYGTRLKNGKFRVFFGGAGTKTISITKTVTTLKTIDPKFLPAGAGGGGGILWATARLDDSTAEPAITHASHTYEEIDAAVQAGKFCILKLDAAGGTGAMVFFVPLLCKENVDGEVYKFTIATYGTQIIIGVNRAGWMMMTTE